jgi:predicted ATPase
VQISLRDFRCFHDAINIEVRPINILVGENSSGKTSLLAGIRFLLDLFQTDEKASFNKDPFYLGSFDQIAHYRGGRFGRAREFSFCIKHNLSREVRRRLTDRFEDIDVANEIEIHVSFYNNKSQPTLSKFEFRAGEYHLIIQQQEVTQVEISTPRIKNVVIRDRSVLRGINQFSNDLSYVDFILRDLRFAAQRELAASAESPKLPKNENRINFEEAFYFSELYRFSARDLPRNLYASAPVRSKPERTYNPGEANPLPSGEHIPFVLAQMRTFEKDIWNDVSHRLNAFGQASGLFQSVSIRDLSRSESGPFQIVVDLNGSRSNIMDVGYGVSQALPIVTDLIRAKNETVFLLQQPEVHLHPKAQAELASFFAQMVRSKKHTLFIETHSDYLIDRLRVEARDGKIIKPEDVSILYLDKDGLDVTVHSLEIDATGNILNTPNKYRSFFINEEFRSLGMKID